MPWWMDAAPMRLFALVTNYGSSSVTPLNLSNPLAPVAASPVTVATPNGFGPIIYFRGAASL